MHLHHRSLPETNSTVTLIEEMGHSCRILWSSRFSSVEKLETKFKIGRMRKVRYSRYYHSFFAGRTEWRRAVWLREAISGVQARDQQ